MIRRFNYETKEWVDSSPDAMRKELESTFPDSPGITDEQLMIIVERMKAGFTLYNIPDPFSESAPIYTHKHFEYRWFGG